MPFAPYRWIFALCVVGFMTACAAPPEAASGFRDRSAPFASTSRFELDRFLGSWQRVAAFAPAGEAVLPQTHLYRRASTGQIVLDVTAPDGASAREVFQLIAPGRFQSQRDAAAPDEALWLLWVDEGYRTAVLGTPSGSRAFILDRSAAASPDRLRAAREILKWYGYDLQLLRSVP